MTYEQDGGMEKKTMGFYFEFKFDDAVKLSSERKKFN